MVNPGQRIRELRMIANMSQEELGRRVGVQRAAIQKYEKGTVSNIPLITLEKIAKTFDVSPTYLVGWDGSEQNQLAMEVKLIQGVGKYYGDGAVSLLEIYSSLSKVGQNKILAYAEDITQIYLKK